MAPSFVDALLPGLALGFAGLVVAGAVLAAAHEPADGGFGQAFISIPLTAIAAACAVAGAIVDRRVRGRLRPVSIAALVVTGLVLLGVAAAVVVGLVGLSGE